MRQIAALALGGVALTGLVACGDASEESADAGREQAEDGGDGDDTDGGSGDDASSERDAAVGSTRPDADSASPGDAPAEPSVPGDVPAELVGIWQETRASSGTYHNPWGADFDLTSGFSVQLKIAENGAYYYAHASQGVSATCASVSYFDQSTGSAVLDGDTLTLYPSERRLDVTDCGGSGSQTLDDEPIPLMIALEETRVFYGGQRTYSMHVTGGPHPIDLTLLQRPPSATPEQLAQPAAFTLGTDGPFQELQGLWVAAPGTDTGFFTPSTGDFYLPELNGSKHQWLRFLGTQYETAVALQNVNDTGVCKSDVVYYEQGDALFGGLSDVSGQGSHFVGDVRLAASAARLIVNVRNCDEDDGATQYDVTPLMSYARFIYFSPANPPESFSMDCTAYPQGEWQSLLCTDDKLTFSRRE